MRSRPMTQVGWRLIQKVQKWAELEEKTRLWKDIESQGTNHDNAAPPFNTLEVS